MTGGPVTQGLLLFGHGARDPRWAEPFETVAQRVRAARPDVTVRLGYLDLMPPDLATAAADLAAAGCTRVAIVPLFLGAGGHVRKDLPALVETLRARHAGVAFDLATAVGESPLVVEAMARAALAHIA